LLVKSGFISPSNFRTQESFLRLTALHKDLSILEVLSHQRL